MSKPQRVVLTAKVKQKNKSIRESIAFSTALEFSLATET